MPELVGALDQGTTSTRFMVFDQGGQEVCRCQLEHRQYLPRPGWVEHDPLEIVQRCHEVVSGALAAGGLTANDLAAVGMANQRETTVIWDRRSGLPYLNAIVWQDTRTAPIVEQLYQSGSAQMVRERTGLPPATYFSAPKIRWALDNIEGLAAAANDGTALAGTLDSWLAWSLTGGPDGGRHVTDVTNASRTMLMGLRTMRWDDELLALFGIPRQMLPEIISSSGYIGDLGTRAASGLTGSDEAPGAPVPLMAVLGDQQAAMVGQLCLAPGDTKNTYGTGNFLLCHTGGTLKQPGNGLISTACYQLPGQGPTYALEGSVAVSGAAVQWLRDKLGIISSAGQTQTLAAEVQDSGGVYFVPAFSGLFAPYWRPDARGTIIGLTQGTTSSHLARATLEAICYQTRDVVLAMAEGTGLATECLKVDGGVTANDLCMQLQADILGIPVVKPVVTETTALGAAYAAGLAAGVWGGPDDLRGNWHQGCRWEPTWSEDRRQQGYANWQNAVERSLGWARLQ